MSKNNSKIEVINPIEYPNWDNLLLTNPETTFFHTSAWAKVLSESYDYTPLYFTIIENDLLSSLIPIMEVSSFLTGKRGVSLPFTDESAPIIANKKQYKAIIEALIQHGNSAGWKHLELRGNSEYLNGSPNSSSYYSHDLDLTRGEDKISSDLRKSNKRNIKRARKEGVKIAISNSWESMQAFYRLNCITRKIHGLPPQPLPFFRKIHERVISAERGFVALASHSNRVVAGAVFFLFGFRAIYKYGASDRKYQHLRANNLIMWEAIRWCSERGIKGFSFGRTEPENKGLLQFKRGWGGEEGVIKYYKYDLKEDSFVAEKGTTKSSYIFFKVMPLPILKLAGNLLYRHVG